MFHVEHFENDTLSRPIKVRLFHVKQAENQRKNLTLCGGNKFQDCIQRRFLL